MNGTTYLPKTDILQTAEGFELWMDLPGVGKKDLAVSVKKDQLEIYGKVRPQERKGLRFEYPVGDFARTFVISSEIDQEAISDHLEDGVLRLRLPKAKSALPLEITVH